MAEGVPEGASDTGHIAEGPRRREHRVLVWLLVILGAVIGLLSVVAIWVDRVALQTDNYVDVTGELLEDPEIQSALSTYLVDELYAQVDVSGEIREQLPGEVKSLAPILAGGGREAAVVAARRAFQFPRVQALWREANRNVHREFLLLIEDKGRFVSTTDGTVTLEVRPLVVELADRVGLGDRVDDRLPEDAGSILLLQSDELGTAQTGVRALRFLADWLWIFAFAFWGGAVYLARSWRRQTVSMIALSFILIGVFIVLALRVGGGVLVDELVRIESNRAAGASAWSIITADLRTSGISLAIIGAIGVAGTWLAGPARIPVAAREAIAPYIARSEIAFGSLALVFLAFIWWAPIPGARSVLWLLVFGGLAFAGMALLRKQTMTEHPEAAMPDVAGGVSGWMASVGRNQSANSSQAAEEAQILERLERLQTLRERGALSEEEFQAQKTALMASR